MRGRSYSPSPPRGYSRRGRSPSPRGRYGDRSRDAPTSLLVRNLRHDCRPEDLRRPFGQFGPVKDIYLPRDYYTGEPRGFGFVQYVDPADAADAKYQMDRYTFQGRQLTVVFAEENRKKPQQMRARERSGSHRSRDYDRRRSSRYSPSPPRHRRSRSPSEDYYSPPPKRRYSRSVSPQEKSYSRERSYSRSPPRGVRSPLPPAAAYEERSISRSRSPVRGRSPPPPYNGGSRSRSRSPVVRSPSPGRGRGRGRSPIVERVYTPSPSPSPRRDGSR